MPVEVPSVDNWDRERGILTPADRQYLRGESGLEKGSHAERRARKRIRDRVLNAFLDFRILFEELEERDADQVFEVGEGRTRETSWRGRDVDLELGEALVSNLAFIFLNTGIDNGTIFEENVGPPLEEMTAGRIIEKAFREIGLRVGFHVEDVHIWAEGKRMRLSYLKKALKGEKELRPAHLPFLAEAGLVDEERVLEAVREASQVEEDPQTVLEGGKKKG